ncbi:MAG: FecR domain-containing protein [Pseudomonadota bacterium]
MSEALTPRDTRILEEAHRWRLRQGEADFSDADRTSFEAWRHKSARHAELYDFAVTMYHALGTLDAADLDADMLRRSGREHAVAVKHSTARFVARWPGRLAVFGSALAACAAMAVFMLRPVEPQNDDKPVTATYQSALGITKQHQLADGTIVTLGAASEITTAYTGGQRRVNLVRGAAYFEVAKDPDRPFLVAAGALTATARGTAFDVRRAAGITRVAVSEGSVEVGYPYVVNDSPTNLKTRRTVSAGEQIAAVPAIGLGTVRPIAIASVAAWRSKRLLYDGVALEEIAGDASRYSAVQVIVDEASGSLADIRVRGSFQSDDIDSMLNTLAEVYRLKIDRSTDGLVRIVALVPRRK